jgi:hypothetical protein
MRTSRLSGERSHKDHCAVLRLFHQVALQVISERLKVKARRQCFRGLPEVLIVPSAHPAARQAHGFQGVAPALQILEAVVNQSALPFASCAG